MCLLLIGLLSNNQYKKQITKWQKEGKLPPKHIKRSESEFMIQKRKQRESEGQKDTLFLYNGWKMPNEKINHLKDRYHIDDSLPTSPPGKFIVARAPERFNAN